MNYLFHIGILIGLYTILGLSLNLVLGFGGMLSLCHAAFYGIGAYAFALLLIQAELPFLLSFLLAVLFTGTVAYLISVPASRFHGDFFVLATLAFQMITGTILHGWVGLTGGPYGIRGIPKPSALGVSFTSTIQFFTFALLSAAVVCFVTWRLARSPFGRALQSVRDDEIAAEAMGKHAVRFRRIAFTIGGTLAACAGVVFASYATYIDPTSFGLDESVFILTVVVVGGTGNLRGPVLGAVIIVLLPEVLRFLKTPDSIAANVRQVIYGLSLVLMMRFRPQGIAGKYAFG